ncbi:hypothetical protein [Mesorhizobium sp. GR13]|uniref:hypothetical protein n=1 Tax=Mesorhizobium sp. GR13 TaxID=2562308 RepID=UPI001484EC31|nr:hypothetical protein [Mesorhizobium sp. GR13]
MDGQPIDFVGVAIEKDVREPLSPGPRHDLEEVIRNSVVFGSTVLIMGIDEPSIFSIGSAEAWPFGVWLVV